MSDHEKKPANIDPAKFFNETEYNTLKIGGEDGGKKETDPVKQLLAILNSKAIGEKDKALDLLKKDKAVVFLIDAIKDAKNPKNKALLIAACWESGIDVSAYLDLFAELAHDEDLFVSMEAITVISENIGEIKAGRAQQLINVLNKASEDHFNATLILDLVEKLKEVQG
jgi:hypothetical protein